MASGWRGAPCYVLLSAGIIDKELERCEMHELRGVWATAARAGCCTMSPDIGRWLRKWFGQDAGGPSVKNTMNLKELVLLLLPADVKLLEEHHTAGADAELHMRLYAELRRIQGNAQ